MPRTAVVNRRVIRAAVGDSLDLNGASGNASVADANQLDFASSWSCCVWVFREGTQEGGASRLISKNDALGYVFAINNTSNTLSMTNSSSTATCSITNAVKNGMWNHVGMVYDDTANTVTFYINGVAVGTPQTQNTNPTVNTEALFIGNIASDAATFGGLIHEPLLFTGTKTAQQMFDLFNGGITLPQNQTNLVFWGRCANGSSTYTDNSSFSNNGTITTATVITSVPFSARSLATNRFLIGTTLDKCINFSASNAVVQFTAPTSFNPANIPQFTVANWILFRGGGGSNAGRVWDLNAGTAGRGWTMLMAATTQPSIISTQVAFNGTNARQDTKQGELKVGEWNRVLFTWDDSDNIPKVYVNGIQSIGGFTTNKSGSRVNLSGVTVQIGNRSAADRAWNGLIDECCVWNRILTAQEIADDYYKMMTPVSTSGLLLRYAMDETTGNLVDASGNGIAGTPSNVTQNVTSFSRTARTLIS